MFLMFFNLFDTCEYSTSWGHKYIRKTKMVIFTRVLIRCKMHLRYRNSSSPVDGRLFLYTHSSTVKLDNGCYSICLKVSTFYTIFNHVNWSTKGQIMSVLKDIFNGGQQHFIKYLDNRSVLSQIIIIISVQHNYSLGSLMRPFRS